MRAIYLIARREYLSYVATWGFWLSLASVPMFMALGLGLPILIENSQPTRYYVLVDETGGELNDAVRAAIAEQARRNREEALELVTEMVGDDPQVQSMLEANMPEPADEADFVRVHSFEDTTIEALRPYLTGERLFISPSGEETELFAAVYLRRNGEAIEIDYWSRNLTNASLRSQIGRALGDYMRASRLRQEGVSLEVLNAADSLRPDVRELSPFRETADAEITSAERLPFFVAVAVAFGLWIIIFSVVNMLLTAMIEEKGNKVLEMMLSSARHHEILTGKLFGVAAVSFTLLAVWGSISMAGGALFQTAATAAGLPIADIMSSLLDPGLIFPALGYFIIGYFVYGAVFLAIGSLCETLQDAQTLMSPIMLVMMVPLFLVMVALDTPDSPIIAVASWVPVWTPFLMLARLPQDPPMIEILGSTALMIITAIVVIWGAGRLFRMGALNQANQETVKNWFRFGQKKTTG
ncbi:MAG: ABC transporter permease [Alphaproteobacteria bacterium]|nr:ABC transporter permease [Alphaproteobacteria bacterium]